MLPENLAQLLQRPDDQLVLDVGGWAAPVNRADWVIDLMPYESRGVLMPGGFGPGPERFDAGRWVVADICSHQPWPFADDQFDFAICTFTLEDVRDPIRRGATGCGRPLATGWTASRTARWDADGVRRRSPNGASRSRRSHRTGEP
jgi:hypothetical protein